MQYTNKLTWAKKKKKKVGGIRQRNPFQENISLWEAK